MSAARPSHALYELKEGIASTAPLRDETPPEVRALVEKIRRHGYHVTDDELRALRARYTEAELFEIEVATALGRPG